jgi:RNA-directed DNA polymerase
MKGNLAHRAFKVASGSISSLDNLAKALGLEISDFEKVWDIPENDRYKFKEIDKSSGGKRLVYNPCAEVRRIQRRINTRIFSNPDIIRWPVYLYGSIPSSSNKEDEFHSRDYVACARLHCGAKSLLKMDIKDFFDNIHDEMVLDIFLNVLKYPEDVSMALTRICTFQSRLVQGALTSSYLAMLSLYKDEGSIVHRLGRKNLVYTRFVDDITISSKVSNYDFSFAIGVVGEMLTNADLPINTKKTSIQYASSSPLTVHGLRICYSKPRLPADEVKKIRSAVQELEVISKEGNYRQTYPYRQNFNRCLGRVNKLARVGHNQHAPLVRRLAKIRPLPSAKEVAYVKRAIERLESTDTSKRESFWYKKHYYRASDRLNLVKRTYPSLARQIRARLRLIKPSYE